MELKYILNSVNVPTSPEEDDNKGLTVWKDGNLVEYLEGSNIIFYFGHTTETTLDEDGNEKIITRAFPVRVEKPVTEEKIVSAAERELYNLSGAQEQADFNLELSGRYRDNTSDADVLAHDEILGWVKTEWKKLEGVDLEYAKELVIEKINKYDVSPEVNSFYFNGSTAWIPRDTRVSLMNSLNIEKTSGKTFSTLWLGSESYTVNIDLAINLLSKLELYALECYNVTAEHRSRVFGMKTVEEVEAFDYTSGYPDKLVVTL